MPKFGQVFLREGNSPVQPGKYLRTAVKCELAAEVARTHGEVRVEVTGSSMLPAVRPGDRLVVRRREFSEVQAGQIVLCSRGGGLVAHRVVRRVAGPDGEQLVTRGDSLLQDDSPVQESEVVGVVVSIERGGGRQVRLELTMRQRAASWVLARWGFATRVMVHLGRARRVAWA